MVALRRLALIPLVLLSACATLGGPPLRVNVASVERADGGAMELRFVAKLRVQNASDNAIEFSGASADLILNGKTVGTGLSDSHGLVPRLGETVVSVPITVGALGEVRQAVGRYGGPDRKVDVVLKGRLVGAWLDDLRFEWRGELAMPQPKGD